MQFLIVMIVLLAVMYVVMIRPQRAKQRAQQTQLQSAGVGEDILTSGGIYGTILEVGEDEVTVQIAPEIEVRVARRAIAGVTPEPEEEEPEADEPAELEESHDEGSDGDPSNEENRG